MQCWACLRPISDVTVVLTRQAGSNDKAQTAFFKRGVRSLELPLIQFKPRQEAQYLSTVLQNKTFDWITLTSPQAARVFQEAWRHAGRPKVRVATFEGSMKELEGLEVGFCPTVSNGSHLAKELPKKLESNCEEVLYPASSKADDALERGLRERHFVVTRLDTYETITVDKSDIDEEDLNKAIASDVLTFASPTAVQAWIDITAKRCDFSKAVACIGSTTAKKARELGFQNVYYSQKPGIDGLVQSVIGILNEKGTLSDEALSTLRQS